MERAAAIAKDSSGVVVVVVMKGVALKVPARVQSTGETQSECHDWI